MGHQNSASADSGHSAPVDAGGDVEEEPKWWVTALQKGLAGAAGTSPQQGSPIAPIAPITTSIIDRIKARRAAAKTAPPIENPW